MWKALFLVAAFMVSMSPADAGQPPARSDRADERVEKRRDNSELARDVERISREIYPTRGGERRPRR